MSTSITTLLVIAQSPFSPPLPPPSPPPTSPSPLSPSILSSPAPYSPPYSPPDASDDTSDYFLYWMIPTLSALGLVLIVLFYLAVRSRLPTLPSFTRNIPVETTSIPEINSIELSVKPPSERKIREQTFSRR